MTALVHFPLEPGCEGYIFLEQAVEDFEQGLDHILIDSAETPELDAPFDESHTTASSVPSGFLHPIPCLAFLYQTGSWHLLLQIMVEG